MSDALVPLCHCSGITEAQAIRASLEARGIYTHVDGEHQRSILGMFGTVVALRIMVPRSRLRTAYQLALEIIPDLPAPDFDDDDGEVGQREPLPLRRALPEDLLPYGEEPDPNEPEPEPDEPEPDEPEPALVCEDEDEDDLAELRQRRSLLGPRLAFASGMLLALVTVAIGVVSRGLILAAVMLLLAYVRVLPITEPREP